MAEGGSPGPAVTQGPPDLITDIIPVDLGEYRYLGWGGRGSSEMSEASVIKR